ncbi:MAG: hypothetical protein AAF539_16530 [Planctomycetota bacterium]
MSEHAATRIQLFGQRGSGTNFLQKLIELNVPTLSVGFDFGYKHNLPVGLERMGRDVQVCVITRNPYDWVRSLHRQPWHVAESMRSLDMDDFLRHPWHCVYDDQSGIKPDDEKFGTEMMFERNPTTGLRYCNALAMRSDRLRRWWSMSEMLPTTSRPVWWVQYESLIRYPLEMLTDLANACECDAPQVVKPVERYKGFRKGRRYQPTPQTPLSIPTRRWIEDQLDWEMETRLGYFPDCDGPDC